ncbi:RDD family protein [Haloechinothrix halophila]|uniref:RDD family protein n=1 Tax=Haloechinothrix halophila TaxID=1069073 RepID=UPI00040C99D9|nr:RDD family protein [Haloechinothrix halophila]
MARWTETWLTGADTDDSQAPPKWPGEKFGLPESGPGSVAGGFRRFAAFAVDLIAASLITALFLRPDVGDVEVMRSFNSAAILAWVVLTVPSAAFFGFTPGMALLGIRVGRLDGANSVGLWRAAVRCVLTVLLIPAAVRNVDGRGWHDRATGTIVVRMR